MSDRFSEKRINGKFCVKLRKNESDIVQCSPRLVEEELWRSQVFMSDINGLKRVARMLKVMKEVFVQDLAEPMKMLKK